MTDDEKILFEQLPADGSFISNAELMQRLRWGDEKKYWSVRNTLVDRGILVLGKGRGGRVGRAPQNVSSDSDGQLNESNDAPASFVKESDLYKPLITALEKDWCRDKRFERWLVHQTAQQGKRDTGGKWSRPDITVVTLSTYPYIPGRHFDVITFEVKPMDSINITSVYEALSHLRSATKSYAMLHVPESESENLAESVSDICAEAKKLGVGVITFDNPYQFSTWEEMVEPIRREPDPSRMNDFLATQFDASLLESILRWFR